MSPLSPQQGICASPSSVLLPQGTGRLCPFPPVCDPLLPPPSTLCSRTSFPATAVPSQLQGAPDLSSRSEFQPSPAELSLDEPSFGTSAELCTAGGAPKFLPGHSIPISAQNSITLCTALLAPGSTEVLTLES